MCYLIKTFSGLEGGHRNGQGGYISPTNSLSTTFDLSAAQKMCVKIKEGGVKSKKALTSSRNFISCTVGARRKRGREGKRRESEGEM